MNETALEIKLLGDPALRRNAVLVKEPSCGHRDILSQMSRLMYAASGIGLAAPQVGVNQAMIVVDIGTGLYKLINPRITKKEGSQITEEGCLSIPGICIKVKRARKITVSAQDEFAKPVTIEAQDLLACVLQHEIDHLRGRLIVDYASFWERIKIKNALEKIRKKSKNEELLESKTKSCKLQL